MPHPVEPLEARVFLSDPTRATLVISLGGRDDSVSVVGRTTSRGMQQVVTTVNGLVTARPLRLVRDLRIVTRGGNDRVDFWNVALRSRVDLGDGHDTCWAGSGNDTILGGAGSDEIVGRSGDDLIDGAQGQDELIGQRGNDTLLGGDGMDFLQGDGASGPDWSPELQANLHVLDGWHEGDAGNDYIVGGLGTDSLHGGDGDDYIDARDGNPDSITDRLGNNTFLVDPHNDTFRHY